MGTLIHPDQLGNLPLFAWAASVAARQRKPVSYAARAIARNHHLPLARAGLLASLAGFYVEECI